MSKAISTIVALAIVSFTCTSSAASLKIKGPSQPFMAEYAFYTGSAPLSGSVSSSPVEKSARVRLPNGSWQDLSATTAGRNVYTNVIFNSTYKHTVSLYLKLKEKFVDFNEKGDPTIHFREIGYRGEKLIDPCMKWVECI